VVRTAGVEEERLCVRLRHRLDGEEAVGTLQPLFVAVADEVDEIVARFEHSREVGAGDVLPHVDVDVELVGALLVALDCDVVFLPHVGVVEHCDHGDGAVVEVLPTVLVRLRERLEHVDGHVLAEPPVVPTRTEDGFD